MNTINSPILHAKIDKLQEYASKLAPYTKVETGELLKNEEKRAAMERWFQLMVDEAVDINAFLSDRVDEKILPSLQRIYRHHRFKVRRARVGIE